MFFLPERGFLDNYEGEPCHSLGISCLFAFFMSFSLFKYDYKKLGIISILVGIFSFISDYICYYKSLTFFFNNKEVFHFIDVFFASTLMILWILVFFKELYLYELIFVLSMLFWSLSYSTLSKTYKEWTERHTLWHIVLWTAGSLIVPISTINF